MEVGYSEGVRAVPVRVVLAAALAAGTHPVVALVAGNRPVVAPVAAEAQSTTTTQSLYRQG